MKKLLLALSALSLMAAAGAGPAFAVPCKDKNGKFVKCPKPMAVAARCKDAHGKFIKCPIKAKVCHDAKGHFIKCK